MKLEGSDYAVFKIKRDSVHTIDPDTVCWDEVKGWLADCNQHHHSTHSSLSKRGSLIRLKLLLIDVNKGCLIHIPDEGEYAALSYKWGLRGERRQPCLYSNNLDRLQQPGALSQPDDCAQTILDAMEICRRVGVPYLWVDALCIIQDSPKRSQHLENMDAIYAAASFTIVPADSENAFHGIHGVSRPRRGAHRVDFDGSSFVFGIHSVVDSLAKTPWATSSWTYQEGILSRRLLVFTKELCCLICPDGVRREDGCTELAQDSEETEPYKFLHYQTSFSAEKEKSLHTFPDWESTYPEYKLWISQSLKNKTLTSSPLKMYSTILRNYLQKGLTKPKDVLNAFAGICAELKPRMGHFWKGLPRLHLLEALTWHYEEIPLPPGEFGPSGKRFYPTGLRTGPFHTWSWAGWEHCPGACISLTSCAFVETRIEFAGTDTEPKAIAMYFRDQNHDLIRLNRSNTDDTKLFDSELTKEDKAQMQSALNGLIVPLENLLIFKTFVLHVGVCTWARWEKGGWAMFSVTDVDILQMRHAMVTSVHLDAQWRTQLAETGSNKLDFAVLGIFPHDELGYMRVIALVISKKDGVCYRQGIAELNIEANVSYEDYVSTLATIGSRELIILG